MRPLLTPKPETLIFLGAGASTAEGAPLQGELFRDYFQYCSGRREEGRHHWDDELVAFFKDFFGIHLDGQNQFDDVRFPTFEEVLGIIELADTQGESFRRWGPSQTDDPNHKPRLAHIHDLLVFLIAEILDHTLGDTAIHHPKLVTRLRSSGRLHQTAFISLNYDIAIDNALLKARRNPGALDLDYTIDFMNFGREWKKPRPERSILLFKLHGSLNWLYCPTCRAIRITPKEKGVCRLKWQPEECSCSNCTTLATPIIIPPTYFKALSNLYLRQIWHAAEQALRASKRIIFCGYSFPDADVHVRYLLKRIELHRETPLDVYVVNEHEDKKPIAREAEKDRYMRFFRDHSRVRWKNMSFEQFCENPMAIEEQGA